MISCCERFMLCLLNPIFLPTFLLTTAELSFIQANSHWVSKTLHLCGRKLTPWRLSGFKHTLLVHWTPTHDQREGVNTALWNVGEMRSWGTYLLICLKQSQSSLDHGLVCFHFLTVHSFLFLVFTHCLSNLSRSCAKYIEHNINSDY